MSPQHSSICLASPFFPFPLIGDPGSSCRSPRFSRSCVPIPCPPLPSPPRSADLLPRHSTRNLGRRCFTRRHSTLASVVIPLQDWRSGVIVSKNSGDQECVKCPDRLRGNSGAIHQCVLLPTIMSSLPFSPSLPTRQRGEGEGEPGVGWE